MRIGFDLDKVFIDYPPLIPDQLIDRLYRRATASGLCYRIPARPEQALRRFTHLTLFRPPIHKNLSFLQSLSKKQHQLYLISSRFSFLETATTVLIKKYQFDTIFDGMYFNYDNNQPHLFKNDTIKKLKLHSYVDDDLALLSFLSLENKDTKLYWLTKKKNRVVPPEHIAKITDLSCILKK